MVLRILPAWGLSLVAAGMIGCAEQPPRFDPRLLQQTQRNAAQEAAARPMRPLPTTLESASVVSARRSTTRPANARPTTNPSTGPAIGTEPTVRMPLREIVQRAVANNLAVRVAGYSPAIEQSRVIEADARFDPVFFTTAQYEHRDTLTAGSQFNDPFDPFGGFLFFDTDEADIFTLQTGIRQNLRGGGQAELRYQAQFSDLEPQRFVNNPSYESDLILQITQPLLRDFGNEINRARITIARNNQKISLLEFRNSLEETLTEIERTYWQLSLAAREVEIQEGLLRRTEETYGILSARSEGRIDVSNVQLLQAQATLEIRRAQLVRAKSRVRDLSDQLKQLMNDPTIPVAEDLTILPSSEPLEEAILFDLKEQINTAMENRLELAQQQLRVDTASITSQVGRNNLLPQLNLISSIGVQGLDGDYGSAVQEQSSFDQFSYSLGLQFEVPIGNRAARAIWQRTLLQRQQAIEEYRRLVDLIALEVKTAAREVNTSWNEMVATRQARFAADRSLGTIQFLEENAEPLTPVFVQLKLDRQAALAEAERAEATAIANYNVAIARLERAKGTLLRYNNVIMEEEERPFAMTQ